MRVILASKTNQDDYLIFPVNPSQMSIKYEGGHSAHSILNYGEIVIPDFKKLTSINFEGFFPFDEAPYVTHDLQTPSYYVEKLTSWINEKSILAFATDECTNPVKEMFCIITSFEIDEKPGAPDDIYYKIALKEYKEYRANISTVTFKDDGKETERNRETDKEVPKTYTVKSGDALWKIAKQCLGDGSRYGEIAEYNGIKNPNLIFPGQVLKMPPEKAVE